MAICEVDRDLRVGSFQRPPGEPVAATCVGGQRVGGLQIEHPGEKGRTRDANAATPTPAPTAAEIVHLQPEAVSLTASGGGRRMALCIPWVKDAPTKAPAAAPLGRLSSDIWFLQVKGSDVDSCLVLPGVTQKAEQLARLRVVKYLVELYAFGSAEVIPAQVPIAKVVGTDGLGLLDVSICNSAALANSAFVRVFGELDPRVLQLGRVLKHWAASRGINNRQAPISQIKQATEPIFRRASFVILLPHGTLSTYTLMLQLFFFLQTRSPPILPPYKSIELYDARYESPEAAAAAAAETPDASVEAMFTQGSEAVSAGKSKPSGAVFGGDTLRPLPFMSDCTYVSVALIVGICGNKTREAAVPACNLHVDEGDVLYSGDNALLQIRKEVMKNFAVNTETVGELLRGFFNVRADTDAIGVSALPSAVSRRLLGAPLDAGLDVLQHTSPRALFCGYQPLLPLQHSVTSSFFLHLRVLVLPVLDHLQFYGSALPALSTEAPVTVDCYDASLHVGTTDTAPLDPRALHGEQPARACAARNEQAEGTPPGVTMQSPGWQPAAKWGVWGLPRSAALAQIRSCSPPISTSQEGGSSSCRPPSVLMVRCPLTRCIVNRFSRAAWAAIAAEFTRAERLMQQQQPLTALCAPLTASHRERNKTDVLRYRRLAVALARSQFLLPPPPTPLSFLHPSSPSTAVPSFRWRQDGGGGRLSAPPSSPSNPETPQHSPPPKLPS
ncbi:polynucleotide adenylyltransferase [Cyclospora cayetanensis]|uniref:Polynucleotide adenylyltransferase n=1 Tax=Cyclospora cayetanensis TaxID=88456 RepID=A0A1D3CYU8_9EIME|nr:polynucleotide adenylyltransferase [Cyclospora cayetanensis]